MIPTAHIHLFALLIGLFLGPSTAFASARVATPETAIETTRFFADHEGEAIFLSPKGDRYALATITGDVKRDGNWFTIMSGGLESIDKARPKVIARMFGRSLGDEKNPFKSFLTIYGELRWIDNDRVGFYWEDEDGLIQFYAANVVTGKVKQLTDHPTSIRRGALGIGPRDTLFYAAKADNRAQYEEEFRKNEYEGFAADQDDLFALVDKMPAGRGILDRLFGHKYFYQSRPDKKPVEIKIGDRETTPQIPGTVAISPTGDLAVLDDYPIELSPLWATYTHEFYARVAKEALSGLTTKYEVRALKQLIVVDLSDFSARPLWNALTQAYPPHVEWSPDGKQVVVGPTFLPPESKDEVGLAGRAIAVVGVSSGKYQRIPYDDLQGRDLLGLRWKSDSRIEVETKKGVFTYRKRNGAWEPTSTETESKRTIDVRVRSDLNTPPVLMAVDLESGREQVLFDPNPELISKFKLGRVEKVSWKARDGKLWEGELYYPADYKNGVRYPYVIQSGHGSNVFSLYGPQDVGLGTGSGVFLAQLLAGRNVGVLQIQKLRRGDTQSESPKIHMNGYDGAVDLLVDKGIADPKRIGIQGFSRYGWRVQHSLVHSEFVFAAAIAADNVEAGYVENSLFQPGSMEEENGGDPSTPDGLKAWLENAAPFNASRIYTPLLKVRQGPGGIKRSYGSWELFTRLRRLNRPVELYYMPDQEAHGGHQPQNPRQVAAIQNRALDWWQFWLKGEEDLSPDKADQYARWRMLRTQHEAVLKQPRPPLLKWTAEPVPGTAQPPVRDENGEYVERPETVQ